MTSSTIPSPARLWAIVTATSVGAAVAGLAFAGWLGHGERIFFALIQSGLALCI